MAPRPGSLPVTGGAIVCDVAARSLWWPSLGACCVTPILFGFVLLWARHDDLGAAARLLGVWHTKLFPGRFQGKCPEQTTSCHGARKALRSATASWWRMTHRDTRPILRPLGNGSAWTEGWLSLPSQVACGCPWPFSCGRCHFRILERRCGGFWTCKTGSCCLHYRNLRSAIWG